MTLTISDSIIKSSGLSEEELILEIAVSLYAREVLSLGKAAKFAKIHRFQFQKALATRKISIHLSEQEVEEDMKTIERLFG
ncbi:MAG: UPF0175 family protein [Bacteroidota bacterium]